VEKFADSSISQPSSHNRERDSARRDGTGRLGIYSIQEVARASVPTARRRAAEWLKAAVY
jgi:hypothetical protein